MTPELIGTFEAVGNGGRRVRVHVYLAFHKDPRTVGTPNVAWAPDPNPYLLTEAGRRVARMQEEPERYIVSSTAVVLTPVGPTADLYALCEARRVAAAHSRRA